MSEKNDNNVVKDFSIIIPTYNEKNNIPFLLYLIQKYVNPLDVKYEVVIVDDNSPDGTYDVVLELKKILKLDINLLKRDKKLGLGSSYVFAIKHCKYSYVLIMDSDLSHHPKYIVELLKKQKSTKAQVVSCTRYNNSLGKCGASNWDVKRIFISKSLNYVCRLLFRSKFSDLTGSYRLYKKEVLNSVLNTIKNKGYLFQVEIALKCDKTLGCEVGEVPIVFIERIYGYSKLNMKEVVTGLLGLVRLMWEF